MSIMSCSFFKHKEDGKKPVAKAFDQYLYSSDIKGLVPKGTSKKDSVSIVKNYIDSWIRTQLVLNKANKNLGEDEKDVEKQLEDYRTSLIIYAYEKSLINQKLDTTVSGFEIENYYNQHQDDFQLKDNIIKVLYLKLAKNSPKLSQVKQWYKSSNQKDRKLLEEYCHQYAINYYLDDDSWLQFNDLLKEIPIKTYDEEQFLKNNRYVEIEDSSNIYLVNISGFKIKESTSPLSFERDNIKSIIINKRKLVLIDDMEKKVYDESLKNNDFKIY
jgi:hypothetical protein